MKKILIIATFLLSSCSAVDKINLHLTENLVKITDKKVEKISALTKEKHYARNQRIKNTPQYEWQILAQKDWQKYWVYDGELATHNLLGVSNNVSYRGLRENKHIQVVFNKYGNLVTSDENIGTYDFGLVYKNNQKISKKGLERHFRKDVYPWIYWGNSAQDKTTIKDRINALIKSINNAPNKEEKFKLLNKIIK